MQGPSNEKNVKPASLALSRIQCTVPEELSRAFTPHEVMKMRQQFKFFDTSGDGSIDKWELARVLIALGQTPTESDLDQIIAEVDKNKDGGIDFSEFCHMMYVAACYDVM